MSKMKQTLYQKQTQNLLLKPKMLQSLEMLTLPLLQLEAHLKMEMINNPMLEFTEINEDENTQEKPENEKNNEDEENLDIDNENEDPDLQKTLDESEALSEILDSYNEFYSSASSSYNKDNDKMEVFEKVIRTDVNKKIAFVDQLDWLKLSQHEYDFACDLIDSVNIHGYLEEENTVQELAEDYSIDLERAKEIHQEILHFEPAGITARSIEECLLAQIQENNELLITLIKDHFQDLIHRRYKKIASKMGVLIETVMKLKEKISHFDPKPGLRLQSGTNEQVMPDLILKKIGDDYEIILNDYSFPKIRLNRNYRKVLEEVKKDKIGIEYLRNKVNSAKFLIKSVYLRGRTLEKVMRSIIKHQSEFFYQDSGYLKPLTYAVIADELQVNESTISRVVSSKFVDTPFGVMCLKDFFTSKAGKDMNYNSVSRHNVEMRIKKMIDEEDIQNPLSDQEIKDKLYEMGINVSRRVVAKYRKSKGILNSHLRRKE